MAEQSTNLPIKNPNDDVDLRVNEYFENYFKTNIKVTDNEYEAVKSFFYNRTRNTEATAALTSAVIQTANELDIYVIDVINEFEATNNLKAAIPMFLNMSRRGTSLLGYIQQLNPPTNITRQTAL